LQIEVIADWRLAIADLLRGYLGPFQIGNWQSAIGNDFNLRSK